uniref:RNA helicase n=1 Tax=Petromyzon marinus TaxID=7757 RepID=A0AAJ7X7Q5_PETMA|nr:probable ATP-dependent RNA helicase DHX37 [Petromyzon marinus]XP_032824377.1 probable ATP-dependent RNA helicase DHX37 [Petromyzon marinus]XP_032824378.1 probable ATP-dependent RNA helicase DHX37 [Petromyzon marinus]XP_032824379.1 probable ATP-dependent RNA helicase DHX37 [Petromyzon marinus]XP_032824380.1 probable ATP-dependent RNA helicase DHX37 [Petromyzon marinus]
MGRLKRRHNWRGRLQPSSQSLTPSKKAAAKEIILEGDVLRQKGVDSSNPLVLPSTPAVPRAAPQLPRNRPKRPLSRKQRKLLEKVLEQKQKKLQRSELLERLAECQASQDVMRQLQSTSQIGSHIPAHQHRHKEAADGDLLASKLNAIRGGVGKRKRKCGGDDDEDSEEDEVAQTDTTASEESDESSASDNEGDVAQRHGFKEEGVATGEAMGGPRADGTADGEPATSIEPGKKAPELTKAGEGKAAAESGGAGVGLPRGLPKQAAVFVHVNRRAKVQEARLALPILGEEQAIMEAIGESPVTVVCGETGSGKSTQLPQFLYEAGYARTGLIGVTEPRRVAAVSLSHRVAHEMNLPSRIVSYQVRYDGNVMPETKIKFMTDGVLLREVQKDFVLSRYSALIIDEAHERSVHTDVLIGLLSRIVPLRHKRGSPLKLVVMSATLRVEDFTENLRLFPSPPPVIKVDARQFPVTVHFNKHTPPDDYVGEAFRKVSKIHRLLPPGGLLVFVTGQAEVQALCSRLRTAFPRRTGAQAAQAGEDKGEDPEASEEVNVKKSRSAVKLPRIDLDQYSVLPMENEDDSGGEDEVEKADEEGDDLDLYSEDDEISQQDPSPSCAEPLYVLPLYSLLAAEQQAKVFCPPPAGSRLCVVATNVAETSLTLPDVRYVVDTGRVKRRHHDVVTGVSSFRVAWVSQASANQRAGRAGRTQAGHCYRLYSSAVFSDLEVFSPPEITTRPVEDLVLQMKALNIDRVTNFPFPTPPDPSVLLAAEESLRLLGALEESTTRSLKDGGSLGFRGVTHKRITPLGRVMATLPVAPRFAKLLALSPQHGLAEYAITLVAGLTVREMFVTREADAEGGARPCSAHTRRVWAGHGQSLQLGDLMVMLSAVGACEFAGCTPEFCAEHGLRLKAMREIRRLRGQLTNSVNSVCPGTNAVMDPRMRPPTEAQVKTLRQLVLAASGERLARRAPSAAQAGGGEGKGRHAYRTAYLEDSVYIHPSSVLCKKLPEYVVYQELLETSRMYMNGVTAVELEWIPVQLPQMCCYGEPLAEPPARMSEGRVRCHRSSTLARLGWDLPPVEVDYPAGLMRYKLFAQFLLGGQVVPKLAEFTPLLLSPPTTMCKTWANLQPRTQALLQALVAEKVDCRDVLLSVWQRSPKFLQAEYCQWLPESQQNGLALCWPPL